VDEPADAPPGFRYFQALVTDPATGRSQVSNAVLQHTSVPAASGPIAFNRITERSGAGVHITSGNSHMGGITLLDYNDDYLPDVFATNGAGGDHHLWRNRGGGNLEWMVDVLPAKPVGLEEAGAVAADFDNDGDVDLFVPVDNPVAVIVGVPQPFEGGPNLLYRNTGDGFVEDAAAAGLIDPRGWRTSAAVTADVDHDGFLDLFLANWAPSQVPGGNNASRLLHGGWDGTFDERGGFDLTGRDALAPLFFDVDGDGWQDLYVGNISERWQLPDFDPRDLLYHNDVGEGFADGSGKLPGFGDDAWAAMGADVADIENDGDWDLYVTNLFALPSPIPRGNPIYLGDGAGGLTDNRCFEAALCTGDSSWPANFADFDRDGFVDLYVGTTTFGAPDFLFHNRGDGVFESLRLPELLDNRTHGAATGDLDGDGAVDLVLWLQDQPVQFLRNAAMDDHHWLAIRLLGRWGNRSAIGATVRVTTPDGMQQLRRVSGGDSAHSQQELTMSWGLGDHTSVDVTIAWPSGEVTQIQGLTGDRFWLIDEADGVVAETLEGTAVWDAVAQSLELVGWSNYRGRANLQVAPRGVLRYDVDAAAWTKTFTGVMTNPGTVTLTSDRGNAVDLLVTTR